MAHKKKRSKTVDIKNKRAYFDYALTKTFEAGVQLFGHEVKAIRISKANLAGGHVIVRDGEAYVVNITISPYQEANTPKEYDTQRPRKLLLHKKEIAELEKAEQTKGLTVIPIKWYNKNRKLKLEIAIAKGKKAYDKRDAIKERDSKRSIRRSLKMGMN